MPPHAGHIAMIDFALQHCEEVIVMVCVSNKETIGATIRMGWMEGCFTGNERVQLKLVEYDESVLPNSSESSRKISAIWADYIQDHFPGIEVFVSSEPYGDYVAGFLGIEHRSFDRERKLVPVSASAILEQPLKYWEFIAPSARSWFVKKVCISGSESTGKSTLTERLGAWFETAIVPEMAREVIETTEEVVFEDLLKIATLHAKTIDERVSKANKILICDTDVHITRSYARYLFDRELVVPDWVDAANRFDLHIFLDTDCDYVQDGTRMGEAERNALSGYHERQLQQAGIAYVKVGGNWEERFDRSREILRQHFFNY